jgi:hypothetical protein
LAARPEVIDAHHYRTQENIDSDTYGQSSQDVVLDVTEEAARQYIPAGEGSIPLANQFRIYLPPKSNTSGNIFVFYETKHETSFLTCCGDNKLEGHKSVQFADDTGRSQAIEPRYRYYKAEQEATDYVAKIDVRIYDATGHEGFDACGEDSICNTNDFYVDDAVWTRHWILLDFDNDKIYYWIGDENRANVAVLDGERLEYSITWPGEKMDEFWQEWNSSDVRPGGEEIYFYIRNQVIMYDINIPTVINLVADGDFTNTPSNLVGSEIENITTICQEL